MTGVGIYARKAKAPDTVRLLIKWSSTVILLTLRQDLLSFDNRAQTRPGARILVSLR